jgi:UDPglucose 6-dehydrogenase
MRVGIAGYGIIGSAFGRCFSRSAEIELHVYDKYKGGFSSADRFDALNSCDVVFVTVPTPFDKKHRACDISAVEDVIGRLDAPACIKSTVPPGTTDRLAAGGKKLAFSPEFMGESPSHRWPEIHSAGFAIFGGHPEACAAARRAYELSSPVPLEYVETSAALAELSKYTLNGFLATKVSFMNQIYDIATEAGLDYEELRKLLLLDPRVGDSHTMVTRERGFGGKCFPKDLNALIAWSSQRSDPWLLQAVADYNDAIRRPGSASAPARTRKPLRIVQAIKAIAKRPRPALRSQS